MADTGLLVPAMSTVANNDLVDNGRTDANALHVASYKYPPWPREQH